LPSVADLCAAVGHANIFGCFTIVSLCLS
jgi:hypothetical protein